MWEKIVYVANDGTEFKSEEEAFEYEMKDALTILSNLDNFIAFDSEGSVMNTNPDELPYTLENAYFMDVKTEKAIDALKSADAAYELSAALPDDIGHFRWDDNKMKWIELLEDLEELNDAWKAIGKKFTLV